MEKDIMVDDDDDSGEDMDVAIKEAEAKPSKTELSPRWLSIISFFILLAASFFSIGWLSAVYFLFGCLYFSQTIGSKSGTLIIIYSILVLIAKILDLILTYYTTIITDLNEVQKDLIIALGFGLISKKVATIILSLFTEIFVIIGLSILKQITEAEEEREENQSRSFIVCHLWFWLMIGFLTCIYLFGNSVSYLVSSVFLLILLICWAVANSIDSNGIWAIAKLCTVFSLVILMIIYAGQVSVVNRLPGSVLDIIGLGKFNAPKDWLIFFALIAVYCCSTLYVKAVNKKPGMAAELNANLLDPNNDKEAIPNKPKDKVKDKQKHKRKTEVKKESKKEVKDKVKATKSEIIEDIEIERKMSKSEIITERMPLIEKTQDGIESKIDIDGYIKPKTRSIFETIKYFFLWIIKLSINTPFGLMLILRIYTIIWTIKYGSYLSVFIVYWNYYSICYVDTGIFCKFTPYLLLPAIIIQIITTKFIAIPQVASAIIPDFLIKYSTLIGCFIYSKDPTINVTWEYAWTLGGVFLICVVMKMMQYIPDYLKWQRNERLQSEILHCIPSNLEVAIRFCLEHTEKIYIIILYILVFSRLNVVNTFLLLFFFAIILSRRFARKSFIVVIIIMGISTIGKYLVMVGYALFDEYDSNVRYAFKVLGIYSDNNKNAILYKMETEWEVILMYFCSYIQLKILRYIAANPFNEIPINTESCFIRFIEYLNFIIQAYLTWIIYIVFFIVLAYQNTSIFIQGYMIIIVLIMLVHIFKNIGNKEFKGQSASRPLWIILALYNTLILFSSYITNFVIYTGEYNLQFDESTLQLVKILGLDFTQKEVPRLQWTFLPQFLILYLSFFARQNVSRNRANTTNEVVYTSKLWMWIIEFLDFLSWNSAHLMFIGIGILGALWSLNFVMLIYLTIFAIHYTTLHLNYLRLRQFKGISTHSYQDKQTIIDSEISEQKSIAIKQRRITLEFVLTIASLSLILTQGFILIQDYKLYVDRYVVDSELIIACAEVIEVLGYYMGMVGIDIPRTPLLKIIAGNLIILYMCAMEAVSIEWCDNRIGYKFVKDEPKKNKQFSLMDIFKAVLMKFAIASAQTIKYKMTMILILKTLLEYIIIGLFLFAATGKKNIQEIAFLPVVFLCILHKLSLTISWRIATYMWILFILQYILCVFTLTSSSTKQQIEDTLFIRVFHLQEWPIYNFILKGWESKRDWAYYLGLFSTENTRYFFILDVFLLTFQAIYYQNFCHSFYTLSNYMKVTNRISSPSIRTESAADYEVKPGKVMTMIYKVLKNLLFVYSHIFTLFCLIVMTSFTEGAINIFYLCFSVGFMQFELFSEIGTKQWKLPMFFKYVLKPYVFLDLALQFAYQIPYFLILTAKYDLQDVMSVLGIRNFNDDSFSIWVKTVIYTFVLYQDAIYSSKEYKRVCSVERNALKKLQNRKQTCMTYLYNNIKVHEFRNQKKIIAKSHAELSMLKSRIDGWNEVLHRKESKQGAHSEAESGILLDFEDSKQKLKRLEGKLKYLHEYPEDALHHTSLLEKAYLWLYRNTNHIFFLKRTELLKLEKTLEKGTYLVYNPIIEYYIKQYTEATKAKISIENLRNKSLAARLAIKEKSPIPKESSIEENEKPSEDRKPYSGFQLILKIIVSLAKLLLSSSQGICFALMIFAHTFNGNILSLVYVFSIFCYALIIKCRPHSLYWRVMLLYAGIVIVLKYSCAFLESALALKGYKDWVKVLQANSGVRIGLFEASKRGMFYFVIFDALILIGIIFHRYVLHSLGLAYRSEDDVETISQAIERIAENNPATSEQDTSSKELQESKQEGLEKEIIEEFKGQLSEEDKNNLVEENKELSIEEGKEKIEKEDNVENQEGEVKSSEGALDKLIFNRSVGLNLFPKLKNEKPGKNYNFILTALQIIFCVYIILFCSNMTYDVTSLSKIKLSEFSKLTVIGLFVQIILILIERYLYFIRPLPSNTLAILTKTTTPTSLSHLYYSSYQTNNYSLMYRLVFHVFQLLLIHGMVFWYFPNDAGVRINNNPECTGQDIKMGKCNEVPCNIFLLVFYILYCLYFAASSIQIRESWPEVEEEVLVKSSDSIDKIISKGFHAIPFAWELQQIASWLWTKTCFDIFQWLKFSEINDQLFLMKCTAKAKRLTEVGTEVSKTSKYTMGGGLLFGLIFLIVVPIFVFSTLNPMVELNNITTASLSLTLNYDESKSFELMRISDALVEGMEKYEDKSSELRKFTEIKGADWGQFQHASFADSSDIDSFPTVIKINDLSNYFRTTTKLPSVSLKYTFIRPEPSQKQQVELKFVRQINEDQYDNFTKLFNVAGLKDNAINSTLSFTKFFCRVTVLPLESNPVAVEDWGSQNISSSDLDLKFSLDQFNKSTNTSSILKFHVENIGNKLGIFTVSEKSKSSFFAGYSIITLYLSVVLVVGNIIRGAFSGTYYKIIYDDMPNPSPLLKLCTGVEIARYENDLVKEGELYYELIEVLRSTELIKLITKTSKEVYTFKKNNNDQKQ